jgi:hypothetical protein
VPAQCFRCRIAFEEGCMSISFQKARELGPYREQLILASTLKSKVSSKYHLNQVWVRLRVRFILRQNSSLPSNLWSQTSSVFPKYNSGTGIGEILIPKMEKTKGVKCFRQNQNLARQTSLDLKA